MKTIFKTAIFALALAVTVSASAEGYMFNNNLKKGMRSADVTALQDRLTAEGVYTYGVSTGYFGNVTLTAVKAYQAKYGITPMSGFVGPLTRASLNSSTVVTTPTTPTTPVVVLNGQEGFGDYRRSPSPVSDLNIQRSSDVAVYGVEVKAKNADISIERMTVNVKVKNGTSYENPSTLINSITVKDGSTVLATLPVNSSTFSKVTTGSTDYYVQISGLTTRVAKDTIKTLTVYFNTNSIDQERTVDVSVPKSGIRVVDGRGISTYNDLSAIDTIQHIFKKPGNSTLTAKLDATTIYATNYRVNALSNGAEKVLTSTFAVKSESGPSKITAVDVTVATTTDGTMPSTLYLYQGSTLLDSRTVAAGAVKFDIENSNIMIAQDTTSTFTIKADMPATTVNGTAIQTTVKKVYFEKADGSSSDTGIITINGPYHFFATVVPELSKVSSTATTVKNNNIDTGVTASVKLNIKANGGDILVGTTTAVIGLRNISTGQVVATSSVSGISESGLTYFADGAAKTVEFTFTATSTQFASGTTNVKAFVESIKYATSTNGTPFNLTAGFEPFDSDSFATFSK